MKDLIIVARHERPLYDYLSGHFAARRDVEVVLDRRQGERRRRRAPPIVERRRQSRRLRSVDEPLASLGVAFVLVRS